MSPSSPPPPPIPTPAIHRPPPPIVSDWAKEEVARAQELRLLPASGLGSGDYRVPIDRGTFLRILMQFVTVQQNCDILSDLANYALSGVTEGSVEEAATAMGLIQGYADGLFHPEGLITRRSAALLLMRAYGACGGTLPETTPDVHFTDEGALSDEVRESAAALASWKVMNGKSDGSFAPGAYYTVEQCIVTFLRLYENAPVSRKNGNVKPLLPYAQLMDYLTGGVDLNYAVAHERLDSAQVTFLRVSSGGYMGAGESSLYFVYQDGGVRQLDIGLCDTPRGSGNNGPSIFALADLRFSEDGKTFSCTVTLPEDVTDANEPATPLHEKGSYAVAVDTETCLATLQKLS